MSISLSVPAASSRKPGPARSDQAEVRVKRALANPVYFGIAYVAPYDPNWPDDEPPPPFAIDMLRFMVAAAPWPLRGGVVMLPPEFMKTTLLQVYALWRTVRARVTDTLLRGMLFSEQEDMAKGNLAVLKWHIENNERLRHDFADGRGRPLLMPDPQMSEWTETSIIVHRPGIVSRDPTWQAKGLDSTGIQGRRLDLFLGDDVVTPRNASSPAKRKSALDTMDLTIETRVVEGGQIILAGNFNDAKDMLSTKAAEQRYAIFKRPTLHKPGEPSVAPEESAIEAAAKPGSTREGVAVTWPENWSFERFLIEYRAKPNRARRIHLLDPRAEQGERLKVSWMTLLAEDRLAPLLRYASFYMGVDPAPGGEDDDLDFMTVTVLALTQGHCDICQSFAVRADTPRQVDLLAGIHDAFQPVGLGVKKIGVSKVTADRYFAGSVEIKRPDVHRKIEPVSIPEAEQAKLVRLEGLGPNANTGWLRCLDDAWTAQTSDAVDQHQEMTLAEEWRDFPYGNHDDRLDSLDIALRAAALEGHGAELAFTLAVAEG